MAAGASGAGPAAEPAVIEVHFEDGLEQGVLAVAVEDDFCDPKFWRFEETHGHRPEAKILLSGGGALFLACWLHEPTGTLVDQDGDEHRYVRGGALVPGGGSAASAVLAAPERGAKAHAAAPAAPEPDKVAAAAATRQAVEQLGSSAAPPGGAAPAAAGEAIEPTEAAAPLVQQAPRGAAPAAAERAAATAPPPVAQPDPVAAPHGGARGGAAVAEAAARRPEKPPATAEQAEEDQAGERPAKRLRGAGPSDAPSGEGATAASAAAADAAGDTTCAEPAGGEAGEATLQEPAAPGCGRAPFFAERAPTARAGCRTCMQPIAKGALRCGMLVYKAGRNVTVWAHARCFLEHLVADYAPGGRGKCQGTGAAIAAGDVRVCFEIGGHRKWWAPFAAARWTAEAVAGAAEEAPDQALPPPAVVEPLEPEHREPLLELLRSGRAPANDLPLRRTAPPARRPRPRRAAGAAGAAARRPRGGGGEAPPPAAAPGEAEAEGGGPTRRGESEGEAEDAQSDLELRGSYLPRSPAVARAVLDLDDDDGDDGFEMVVAT